MLYLSLECFSGSSSSEFVLYSVIVRGIDAKGFPVAFIILSSNNQDVIQGALQKFKEVNPGFYPG